MSVNQGLNWRSPALLLTGLLCLGIGAMVGAFATSKVIQKQASNASGQPVNSDVSITTARQTTQPSDGRARTQASPFAVTGASASTPAHTSANTSANTPANTPANTSTSTSTSASTSLLDRDALPASDFRKLAVVLQSIEAAGLETLLTTVRQQARISARDPAASIVNRALFQRIAELSPQTVMQWLDEQVNKTSPWQSESIILDALAGLTTHSASDAEQWLAGHTGTQHHAWQVHAMYETQAVKDPERLLNELANGEDADGIAYSIIGNWASRDPAAAFEWIRNNASNPMALGMSSSVIEAWLPLDRDAALAAIETFPDQENQAYMLSRYASSLAYEDPQAAYDWVLSRADEELRTIATMDIIPMWADQDVTSLMQMIESETDPVRQQELYGAASHQLVYAKGQDDPVAAVQWAETLPEMARMMALPTAFDNWLYQNPKAAVAWLGTQSESPTTRAMQNNAMWVMPEHDLDRALDTFPNASRDIREASVSVLVSELSKQRPAELDSFVNSIDHPDVRRIAETARDNLTVVANADAHFAELNALTGMARIEKMWTLFQALGTHDPERIEQWMAENPLSVSEQQAIEQYAMTQASSDFSGGMHPPPMFDHYRQYGLDY